MIRRIRNRRRTAKRNAQMAAVVVEAREATVAALGASTDVVIMSHLIAAADSLDAALRILVPDAAPAELFPVPELQGGPR